jgi:hypothetical protein
LPALPWTVPAAIEFVWLNSVPFKLKPEPAVYVVSIAEKVKLSPLELTVISILLPSIKDKVSVTLSATALPKEVPSASFAATVLKA